MTYTDTIIRRIDDMGRVCIPKEMRKALGIKEMDRLEFFIDKGNKALIIKKYMPEAVENIYNQFDDLSYNEKMKFLQILDKEYSERFSD